MDLLEYWDRAPVSNVLVVRCGEKTRRITTIRDADDVDVIVDAEPDWVLEDWENCT